MNERIQELAKEAYIKDSLERNPKWKESEIYHCLMNELDSFFEKFAELIVRECASQAAQWTPAGDQGAEDQEKYILKHFGVEE